jgi:hypothetical protein
MQNIDAVGGCGCVCVWGCVGVCVCVCVKIISVCAAATIYEQLCKVIKKNWKYDSSEKLY